MRLRFFLLLILFVQLPTLVYAKRFPWNKDIALLPGDSVFVVVKGLFDSPEKAQEAQGLIQLTLKKIPADSILSSDDLEDFPPGKWVVGTLFDSLQRAQWWMDFSHRNKTLKKPFVKKTTLKNFTRAVYFPDSHKSQMKRFISEKEAIALVAQLPDIKVLAQSKKLKFLITDYPRSGDLRYEVEVLEVTARNPRGIMVDFIMVDAVNQKVTERYLDIFKKKSKTAFR